MLNNRLNSDDQPKVNASLGTTADKTQITISNRLNSTATGRYFLATFNVPSTHTFYLQYQEVWAFRAVISATAATLGSANLETAEGATFNMTPFVNPTTSQVLPVIRSWAEPLFVTANTTIRVAVQPHDATNTVWFASLGGYLKLNT